LKKNIAWLAALGLCVGCMAPVPDEGGANSNDRSNGGEEGEILLTGSMTLSPDGELALMQRNTTAVLVDLVAKTTRELPFQPERFVFSKVHHVGYAVRPGGDLVALDLESGEELWTFSSPTGSVHLLRVADEDDAILLGDGESVFVLDPATGLARGSVESGPVGFATFLPARHAAILVGATRWVDHQPATALSLVDLANATSSSIDVPNCEAKIVALPDESRALLSPTFCEEGKDSNPDGVWTNPDPVSVIDIAAEGLSFVRNLPGFGPVALSADGSQAVAYLDTKRMDPSMFDDPAQVPSVDGDRYHLMVIDPVSQKFTLDPIGNALPRFAMTPDGSGMLVDSSMMYTRLDPKAKLDAGVTIDENGLSVYAKADLAVFAEKAAFGFFDLEARSFTSFAGPEAPLDRFVQTGDGRVFTLKTRSDGLGGDLFRIDVDARATLDLGRQLRDIGLLPDKKTLLLRIRQPALQVDGMAYTREDFCLSLDAITCDVTIHYQDPHGTPVEPCDYHDC